MQPFLNNIIAPNQNAFIKGRLIADNIFLPFELMKFIHKSKKTKKYWCVAKIDIAKAYDKINWRFIQAVLEKMNFPPLFIKIIM